jgi:hypothetical protein
MYLLRFLNPKFQFWGFKDRISRRNFNKPTRHQCEIEAADGAGDGGVLLVLLVVERMHLVAGL